LQPTNNYSDNLAQTYNQRPLILNEPRRFPAVQRAAAVVAAWLVPGAGHLVLGRLGRAALFFVTITGSFILGLALDARLFWPATDSATGVGMDRIDLISALWFFAQIGSGLCYIGSHLLGFGLTPRPEAATFEYGNTFTFLAGLLNYLVVHDAFDIAAGRKR
jgi:hypothetical protein